MLDEWLKYAFLIGGSALAIWSFRRNWRTTKQSINWHYNFGNALEEILERWENVEALEEALLDAKQIETLEKRWGSQAEAILQEKREQAVEANYAKYRAEINDTFKITDELENTKFKAEKFFLRERYSAGEVERPSRFGYAKKNSSGN